MEFIGYYYCDVILLKVITTASIKDQTNRVSAVFQARRVKGDISVTGTIRDSYFSSFIGLWYWTKAETSMVLRKGFRRWIIGKSEKIHQSRRDLFGLFSSPVA